MNDLAGSSPLGGLMGGREIKPATPAATTYALLFGAVLGIGGVIMLVKSSADAVGQTDTSQSQ